MGEPDTGWIKHPASPVLGGELGTCFDLSVLVEDGLYRMAFSWRDRRSIALSESRDGIHWSSPRILLAPRPTPEGWENDLNRPSILKIGGVYHLWYTGQDLPGDRNGHSWIWHASSPDGRTWERDCAEPVLTAQEPWEKGAVMCPHVLWDEEARLFRMWYSAGEQYEPDAIGCAQSPDGLRWTRTRPNPVFSADPGCAWERHKVTACQVIRKDGYYWMFYIGFRDEDTAQIGLARSRSGLDGWERSARNPILAPTPGGWDEDACYKPFAVFTGREWLLWYNGRRGHVEQIGLAYRMGEDLGF